MPYVLIRSEVTGAEGVFALFPSGNVRNVSGGSELAVYASVPVRAESNGKAILRLQRAHQAAYGELVA